MARTLSDWIEQFNICHNLHEGQLLQWCWPNGKSGIEQMKSTINAFDIIRSEAQSQINKKIKQQQKNG